MTKHHVYCNILNCQRVLFSSSCTNPTEEESVLCISHAFHRANDIVGGLRQLNIRERALRGFASLQDGDSRVIDLREASVCRTSFHRCINLFPLDDHQKLQQLLSILSGHNIVVKKIKTGGIMVCAVATPEAGIQMLFDKAIAEEAIAFHLATPHFARRPALVRAGKVLGTAIYCERLLTQDKQSLLVGVLEAQGIFITP